MKAFLALSIAILAHLDAHAFDRAGIKDFIESRNLKSVEEFVVAASKETRFAEFFSDRNTFVLYRSASLQPADPSSPERPRVIRTSQDAKLIWSISGFSDTIEIIQFNDTTKSFEFLEVNPTLTGTERFKLHQGPGNKCAACHSGRPNWDPYPMWPGFYGGMDGGPETGERALASALYKGKKALPLFDSLPMRKVGPDSYLVLKGFFLPFTDRLTTLNSQRIAALLARQPKYPVLKFAMRAAAMDCANLESLVPRAAGGQTFSDLLARTTETHGRFYAHQRELFRQDVAPTGELGTRPSIEESLAVAKIRYIAQFFDLRGDDQVERWAMSRPSSIEPTRHGEFFGFRAPSSNGVIPIAHAMAAQDSELAGLDCAKLGAKSLMVWR